MNKKILILLMSIVGLVSCIDDTGNYTYTDLDKVECKGIKTKYTRVLGDTISIFPKMYIDEVEVNYDNYEYCWLVYNGNLGLNRDTISYAREWDKFTLSKVPAGIYEARFVMKDKKTKCDYYQRFELVIINDLSRGILVMTDNDSKMRIDFINILGDKFSYKRDILAITKSQLPEQTNPHFITTFIDNNAPGRNALWILTDQGANRLNYIDYSWEPRYGLNTFGFGFPENFNLDFITTNPMGSLYAYKDGNVWGYTAHIQVFWIYNAPINRYNNGPGIAPTTVRVSKNFDAPNNINYLTLFDEESKSFVYTGGQRFLNRYVTPQPEDKLFDFNNTGLDLIWMGAASRNDASSRLKTTTMALVKDPANKVFLYQFETVGGKQKSISDMSNCPDIINSPYMLISPYNQYLIYYLGGNKKDIYCYHLTYQTVKKVYSVSSSSEIITSAHFLRDRTIIANAGFLENIGIATYNSETKQGKLSIKEYDIEGNLTTRVYSNQVLEWEFDGKPVSFSTKQ